MSYHVYYTLLHTQSVLGRIALNLVVLCHAVLYSDSIIHPSIIHPSIHPSIFDYNDKNVLFNINYIALYYISNEIIEAVADKNKNNILFK